MDCAHVREQLDAYEDGELDAIQARELEAHLVGCPTCLQAEEQLAELRDAVRKHAIYHSAPAAVRDAAHALVHNPARRERNRINLRWWQLGGLMSASAAAAVFCALVIVNVTTPSSEQKLASELVSDHVRSLMQDHLLDVASTDQHTVKPWFAGKLDYSPPVHDLSDAGFALAGGRLEYVDGRPVAALIYQRRQHRINVFVWPSQQESQTLSHSLTLNGYNALGWNAGQFSFWAVSDLNAEELGQLKVLLTRDLSLHQ
jgi:anti-sigma factor RsiW